MKLNTISILYVIQLCSLVLSLLPEYFMHSAYTVVAHKAREAYVRVEGVTKLVMQIFGI